MKDIHDMATLTEKLERGRKMLLKLMKEAEDGASELCNMGKHEDAAKAHRMAAHLRLAYAEGRTLGGDFSVKGGTS